jgi:hypothetical protein
MHGLTSRDMGRMAGPIQQAGHVHKSEEASPARSSRRHYRTPPDGSKHGERQRHSVASYHREVNRNGGKERRHAWLSSAFVGVVLLLFFAGASVSQGSFEGRCVLSGA